MKPVDLDLQKKHNADIEEGDVDDGPGGITLTDVTKGHQEHNHGKNKKNTSTSKILTKTISANKIANKKRKKFPILPLSSNRKVRRLGNQRPLLQQDDEITTASKDETGNALPQAKNDDHNTSNSTNTSNITMVNTATAIATTNTNSGTDKSGPVTSNSDDLNRTETGSKTTTNGITTANRNTPTNRQLQEDEHSSGSSTCSEVSDSGHTKNDRDKEDPPVQKIEVKVKEEEEDGDEDLGQLCEKFHCSGVALEQGMNRLDIICGRGNGVQAYPGNIYFRTLVKKYKDSYIAANRTKEKRLIIRNIIARVHMVGGRFLKADRAADSNDKSKFIVLSPAEAEVKTAQALRDTINRSRIATSTNNTRKGSKTNITNDEKNSKSTPQITDTISNLAKKTSAIKNTDANNTDAESPALKKSTANKPGKSTKKDVEEKGKNKTGNKTGGKGQCESDNTPTKKRNSIKDDYQGTNGSSSSVSSTNKLPDRRPSSLNIVIDETKRQKIMSIEREVSKTNDQILLLKRELAKAEESKQILVQSIFDEIFSSPQPSYSFPDNDVDTNNREQFLPTHTQLIHSYVNGVKNVCQTTSSNQRQEQSNSFRDRATMNINYIPPNITSWANSPSALSYQQLLNMTEANANGNNDRKDITRLTPTAAATQSTNAFINRDIKNTTSSSPTAAPVTSANAFINNDIINTNSLIPNVASTATNTYTNSSNARKITNCHSEKETSSFAVISSPSSAYRTGVSQDLYINKMKK